MDEDIEVAYLGPPGTYSHQVALSLYPTTRGDGSQEASTSRVTLTPCATITDAANFAVAPADGGSRRRRLALLPLKNSTHGIVKETEAFLASSPVAVQRVKTVEFAVRHALLVNRKTYERLQRAGGREESNEGTISDEALKSIEKVYSHEQVRSATPSTPSLLHHAHPFTCPPTAAGPRAMPQLPRLAPTANLSARQPRQCLKHSAGGFNDRPRWGRGRGCYYGSRHCL